MWHHSYSCLQGALHVSVRQVYRGLLGNPTPPRGQLLGLHSTESASQRRHPASYPELELSHLVQSAALLGVGLLYQQSCHRCLGGTPCAPPPPPPACRVQGGDALPVWLPEAVMGPLSSLPWLRRVKPAACSADARTDAQRSGWQAAAVPMGP